MKLRIILKKAITLIFLIVVIGVTSIAQKQEILLNTGWKAKRANEVPADGTVISSSKFKLYGWMDAVIPGTVLTTLLYNKKVPDPFFGMNNEHIPDIYETGAYYYTFWFQKYFDLPELKPNQQVWLKFRGINYSANVFLNGNRINKDVHKGMFLREKYLITPFLNPLKRNNLAIIVEPPIPVGKANGGQGGDGTIARSVTQQFTAGWDWICPIRDRNTGIWDQVAIEITGPVDLRDPFVKTRVPGKRKPGEKQESAFISISADLVNSSKKTQTGSLITRIGKQKWTLAATINAGEKLTLSFPEIEIDRPKLWWPKGMGEPNLYDLQLSFEQNKISSDRENVQFGIRQTDSYFDEKVGARVFKINGQKIFIKGGNWIASDAMLRLSEERYDAEVKMHTQMNMNMIRIWGGSMPERPEFYNACDKYGLLVWQDLWVSGDCNGRWFDPKKKESQARRQEYPDDHSLFIKTVIDQIKMLRNHPSLYLWCGGNEFPPSKEINQQLEEKIFPEFDGTRYYLNESTSDSLLRNTIGGNGDGPYSIQNPLRFFTTQSYPFNPEIGSVGFPNVETMRKIMSEKDLQPPKSKHLNQVWRYHKYIGYANNIERFGKIAGIEDFCKKAQVVNYEQYRALQEGFNAGMWNRYTGMLVWKNQNPWTALRGQFYDVFLDQNGGFYGYKHGAKPLHIQLNLNDSSLCVVNQTLFDANELFVNAQILDLHGAIIEEKQFILNVAGNAYKIGGKLFEDDKPNGFYFVRLILKNNSGKVIDENLYWLTNSNSDMKELGNLRHVSLQLQIENSMPKERYVNISNNSNETAFFVRLKVTDNQTEQLALPVYFEDNYVTLFPRESRQIKMDLSNLPSNINTDNLQVSVEPCNGSVVTKKFE